MSKFWHFGAGPGSRNKAAFDDIVRHSFPRFQQTNEYRVNETYPMMRKKIESGLFRLLAFFDIAWHRKPGLGQNRIFLTFDDGPHPQFTLDILETLNAHNAKATFFLVGEHCQKHEDIVAKIVADGHTVANHSFDHTELKRASWAEIRRQIETTDFILRRYCNDSRPYIRPPKGDWGISYLLYTVAQRRKTIFWSVDPRDFECASGEEVLQRLNIEALRDGDIMLLHDKSAATADAVRRLVPCLLDRGFSLHSLPRS